MRLKLHNVGIIEEANINIEGITLIAGQNDSGKSTIGKVLYSLIRSFNIDEVSFNNIKKEYVRSKIRDIRFLLARTKANNKDDNKIQEEFLEAFYMPFLQNFGFEINSDKEEYSFSELLVVLSDIKTLFSAFSNEEIRNRLNNYIQDIQDRITIEKDSQEFLLYEIEAFLNSEFGNQIKNKFNTGKSFIDIEGIKRQRIFLDEKIKIEGFEKSSAFYYDNVFFIETPLKLNNRYWNPPSNINRDKNLYLNSKIFQPEVETNIFSEKTDSRKFNSLINDIIKGEFKFNPKKELIFKKNGVEFDLNNTATGIKSFGVLQLLLEKGLLNSNSLLIIDEPEVHLHPTWQVKYAEILVLLAKEFAVPIVLTSHSPYFIEALEVFSKKYQYIESTNFYYAEKNKDQLSSKILNVNDNLSKIYKSISEAYFNIKDAEYE